MNLYNLQQEVLNSTYYRTYFVATIWTAYIIVGSQNVERLSLLELGIVVDIILCDCLISRALLVGNAIADY